MSTTDLYLTRDLELKRFVKWNRPIILAAVFGQFYDILVGNFPQSTAARSAFAHAMLKYEPAVIDAINPETDAKVKAVLSSKPQVVLLQGQADNARQLSKFCQPYPAPIEPNQPNLEDVIFLPFSLEQIVKDSSEDSETGDDVTASFKLMALAMFAYELAHLVYLKTLDVKSPDLSEEVNDVGLRAVESLFGYHFKLIAYADGTRQLVHRRLPPEIVVPPVFNHESLRNLLGSLPRTLDVTTYSEETIIVQALPPWSRDSIYKIVSIMCPGGYCHHNYGNGFKIARRSRQ